MLVVEPISHIRLDERGVAWIADSNIKVIEVAMDHAAYEWDAEEIHAAHPHLSLAHINAALSYYHDHKFEMDRGMERQVENSPPTAQSSPRTIDPGGVAGPAPGGVSVAFLMEDRAVGNFGQGGCSRRFCQCDSISPPAII